VFLYDRIILAACNRERKGETQGEGTPPMINYTLLLPSFQTNITILRHDDYKDWQNLVDNNPLKTAHQTNNTETAPPPINMWPKDDVWTALHNYVYTKSDTDTDTDTDSDTTITDTDNDASFADNNKQSTTTSTPPSSTDSMRKNTTV